MLLLILWGGVGGLGKNAGALTTSPGQYPNTEICAATPTITFPTDVTIGKEYLFLTHCATPTDFNSGDFVSAWIEDSEHSPIKAISEYKETSDAIVWISPLSDTAGQAWKHVQIDPAIFDCNETGIPYTIKVNWDTRIADLNFTVYCPTINLKFYRQEVNYWEKMRVVVETTDNRGYIMRDVPCTTSIMDFSTDGNYATIRQENIEKKTDNSGLASFEFNTGLLNDLLQGYEYTTVISCLGADKNFTFTVEASDPNYLNNPLYFTIVFISDNIIAIIMAFIIAGFSISMIYLLVRRDQGG